MTQPVLPTGIFEGALVAGKYRIERILGAGGMGVVVRARNESLDQLVAIKFLLPSALTGTDTLTRFTREARSAAKIESEHVGRVFDVAELDDGMPYMVMEYLDGRDLAAVVAERGPLPYGEAVAYILQACEALAEAHAMGMVHRDIKPSNIFLANKGTRTVVKVLDFGITKSGVESTVNPALTSSGTVMGSPLYMSPEQMSSARDVDVRADIWSLGVTLFELIGGRPPFQAESITELIAAVIQRDAPGIRTVRTDVPEALDAAIAQSLTRQREQRFRDLVAFAKALAPFSPKQASISVERIGRALEKATPMELAATAPQQPQETSSTGATWGTTKPPIQPLLRGRLLIGAGVLVVAAAAAVVVMTHGSSSKVATAETIVDTSSATIPHHDDVPSASITAASPGNIFDPVALAAPVRSAVPVRAAAARSAAQSATATASALPAPSASAKHVRTREEAFQHMGE